MSFQASNILAIVYRSQDRILTEGPTSLNVTPSFGERWAWVLSIGIIFVIEGPGPEG